MSIHELTFEELMEMASSLLVSPESPGVIHEANDYVNHALYLRPLDGMAWLLKSQVMSSLEDDPSALAAAEMSLRRLPRNSEAHYTRGAVLADLERFPESFKAVGRAFRYLDADDGWLEEDLYFLKGALLDVMGREEDAVSIFEQGLERHPDSEILRGGLEPIRRERMRRHLRVIDGGKRGTPLN